MQGFDDNFLMRLQKAAHTLHRTRNQRIRTAVSEPGGEYFLINISEAGRPVHNESAIQLGALGGLFALRPHAFARVAAVLLEPIPATLGMPVPQDGYLQGVQDICLQRGAKLILDEVQTGLGRTGRFWCYQHDGLSPDVVVTGKGLSGGIYPIAATLMTAELHRFFHDHPFVHISTFGGAELGCRAALAVLDIVEEPGFLDGVNALADRFAAALSDLPCTLRRRGLMMGLKFPMVGGGMLMMKRAYDEGLFCVYANNDTSVLQFLPPLILSDDEADEIVRRVRRMFE